jgi:aarF domain-containing kinase
MFPSEFCNVLSHLHCNAPKHSWGFTKKVLEEELGDSVENLFDSIDKTPIASGSVSLIYDQTLLIWNYPSKRN